ncbi:YigZ family protein [Aminiphilus sp.]|uniref:IMPACT family protein n=1 Tax=Aminiphilus sp. TaxID=1872488 RepID=UPI00262CE4D2|nr:YigZ family protein [Aminiphilus sp.]
MKNKTAEQQDSFLEPAMPAKAERTIRRSLFLGHVRQAATEEEARNHIRDISRQYADANHNCWAYRVGYPSVREYYSDAGEPSGSAGKPILGAILRSGLTHVVVVVTRYFGGIKLGVRGLIDAYGGVATEALSLAGVRERRLSRLFRVTVPYEGYQLLLRRLAVFGIVESDLSPEFGASVIFDVAVPRSMEEEAEALFDGHVQRGLLLAWERRS